MAWYKKKPDPISDRARALNEEIAQLETEIKKLDGKLQRDQSQPRLRSTAVPHGATLSHSPGTATATPRSTSTALDEPIFEEVNLGRLEARADAGSSTPDHYNDLGVRKYDLPALLRRVRNHLRGPSTSNPKLVSYLAAGGIQGLRPLRYEKRVARNRFIVLAVGLFLMFLGLVWVYVHNRR